MTKKPVAFFDIDGTVFRSSLLIELVEEMIRRGIFPIKAEDMYASQYHDWLDRDGTYEDYINAVVESFITHIKGVPYGDLADIGRDVVEEQGKRVYRYTRDLIGELKQKGYYVVAISQSPKTILDVFCKEYGFDKVYGRIYEIGPQDSLTGACIDEHLIQNKANIVSRVFEQNSELTSEDSIAVGDTEGDISLLESVDQPICFNPNKKLYNHAKTVGWKVVVERKNVVYDI